MLQSNHYFIEALIVAQNLVIPNKDNKVVFVFGGVDLTLATNIVVNFGQETYSTTTTPSLVVVNSATELSLDLSSTSEVGKIFATITYFDASSANGTDITSRELNNIDQIVVAIGTQLIIEDGSIVAGANSYATDDEFYAFANSQGYALPATQPDREALLIQAYYHMTSTYEPRMQGHRVNKDQTGFMPRKGVYANGFYISSTEIPEDFKTAQYLTALAINDGVNTNAVKDSADLASFEVVGVYKESYQSGVSSPTIAQMPAVSRTLRPYTKGALSGGGIYRENMGYLY